MKKIMLFAMSCMCFAFANAQDSEITSPNSDNWSGGLSFSTTNFSTSGTHRAVVDMNGDHLDDIVSVTPTNINIFYQQPGGTFTETNITTTTADNSASWSLAAGDYDGNGYTDLLYGGGSGVTFMRANSDGTGYTEVSGPEFVFSQRSNFIDINNDGHLDAFVCHDVEPNVYYINDGSGNLSFIQGGIGDYPSGGNYGSVWIDYDNDRDMDMFIAKCGGEVARRTNQMHRNNGDGTFTEVGTDVGLDDPMQTWSSAWGDYDNDGDMDVFVGASTGTHKLMRNNGDGTFTDVTAASNVDTLSATGIENATHDFDNDGNLDIVSNGNILMGNGDLTFTTFYNNIVPGDNGSFGDLTGDGYIDLFSAGVLYENAGGPNNWITINTVGTDSNIDGIGARVELETASGVQIRDVRSGEGFRFMSSLNTRFGIGTDTAIEKVTVYWPSGIIDELINPNINEAVTIVEGTLLGLEDTLTTDLILYPNPTSDILNLSLTNGFENTVYTVFDATGKRVLNAKLQGNSLDVSSLQVGNYILRILQDGTIKTQRFIKK